MPDAEEPSLAGTMRLFRGRSTIIQLLFFLGSLLVWGVVFAAVLKTGFGPSGAAAATPDGYRARMLAGLCASVVVGVYYGIGFLYGFGGPFWNPVLSGLVGVVTPSLTLPLLVADAPSAYTPNPADFLGDPEVVIPTLPGVAAFFVGLWVYQRLFWGSTEWRRWAETHLPEDTFIDVEFDP